MKKIILLLSSMMCLVVCILVSSCGKQASSTTTENSIVSTIGPEIYPEVIIQERVIEDRDFTAPYIVLAFKTNQDEYVVYDNDADYTLLCQDAKIVGNICRKWVYNLMLHGERNRTGDEKLWNDSIQPWLETIAHYTREYYYGDKNCIPNDVFDFIDRYNYDENPLFADYSLRKSKYNEKVYGTPSGYNNGYFSITYKPLSELNIPGVGKTLKCVTLKKEDLPSNILVCQAPYF